ncbi:MAG: ribonucleoside-triphosphate reductase [Candidatus Niyogibacteria bacterium CG10_big_fil_rev_8_21_14_0_10_46_36]|uniref:Ribonucleoside-triphosphate reductase n=1 Tax=Candidatus Niyogibacteria bacterium CG10_big_fil_rev_8_21_14_0_10_46_36 TaxID=1974726 RepID=A0A2H0TE09_9BACT|nr:MAG: ribonucleoside-triphosphate reductase [Candidatus Niyogibacteria bacterium CG10_big_fil_rev_8_21_14_0_10_46_36]
MVSHASSFLVQSVRKRDGRVVPFDKNRISSAISRAMQASGEGNPQRDSFRITDRVIQRLAARYPRGGVPSIEAIQDIVEESLILLDFPKTAKAYILYRSERAHIREKKKTIPEHIQKLAQDSKTYFRNPLAEFIYYRTYSRWIEDEGRRETWIETVDRYINFMRENIKDAFTDQEYQELRTAILKQEVMPSMRLLWSAGEAARKTNATAYNCSFIAPSKIEDFAEIMYLLMCGTGVGYSVESQTVQQLPIVRRQHGEKLPTHVVGDSKEGWAEALTLGLKTWYAGKDIAFDYSQLRPAGARLSTMGGRSSGPEPLRALLDFSRSKILARQGRRLSNLDIHDVICKTGEVVVMGGVRRSALISLSDLDDKEMRHAKTGQFYLTEPQRSMANNSAVYNERPTATEFMQEWLALAQSGTGERGIFNRGSLKRQLPARRWKVFKPHSATCGTNPCGEIVLRSKQFCNLSEVVAREEDTQDSLFRKARLAAMLGTYQSSLTHFPFLSKEWKENCAEERLLGVSITGQWDAPAVRNPETLERMKEIAVRTNEMYARRLGINPSTCVTCVKPSGTVSQLVDASSGMHTRHAKYYIRRVRISATDPLFHMLKDQKFPYYPEVGQHDNSATTFVLEFPVKAPEKAIINLSALDQLKHWEMVKSSFTEHNPSVTVSVGHDEWIETANWLYKRWDILGGLSFLPKSEHAYQLAPYEAISAEKYHELMGKMPKIDFSQIVAYEKEDNTTGAKELACVSGTCEIDIDPDEGRTMPEKITSESDSN